MKFYRVSFHKRFRLLSVILILSSVQLYAQKINGVKYSNKGINTKCKKCVDAVNEKPKEVHYGVMVDEVNDMYFVVNQKEWFKKVIKHRRDGIALDIVRKDRYDCSIKKFEYIVPTRGDFQEPIWKKELKKNTKELPNDAAMIYIGQLPEEYRTGDREINVLFINKKHWCYYNIICDIKDYRWDLLDMGMYFDTLAYKDEIDTTLSKQENYILKNKKMRFSIPFEKNKSEYSSKDIQPLYDSLNLTDFNIKKITIRAYSSVEGDEQKNMELTQKRAESIAAALQSYQQPTITTEISTGENWMDFIDDITYTPYSNLADLSKEQIKEELKSKKIQKDLEPFLSKHRKAVVVLELQKKDQYSEYSTNELVNMFSKSIAESNLEQAITIQNSIYEKIKGQVAPVALIDSLQIPKKEEYSILLTKNAVFKYFMNEEELFNTYEELLELQDLLPKDGHIKYNICVLKFRIWLLGKSAFNPEEFKEEINRLKQYNIPANLIKRMLVNYEIVMCEYHMQQGNFEEKDKSLKFISSNYKKVPMAPKDFLSLAQYYVSYSQYDWATKLIEKKVKSPDADEDLLFYYLNLTLMDDNIVKRTAYKAIILNAVNLNKERYCKLFDTNEGDGKGAISFQLLENDDLRKSYCEYCK